MPQDWFASNAPSDAGADWFAANASDAIKGLPPAAGPHVQMHEHNLVTGNPNPSFDNAPAGATGDLLQAAKGMTKSTLQVTAPGVAVSILNKKAPRIAAKLPAVITENATPLEQLPGQIVTTGLMGMEGGLGEPDVLPGPASAVPSEVAAAKAAPSAALGLVRKAALKFALKKIPGYHTASDAMQFAKDVLQLTQDPGTATEAQPVPQTEGTPWGKPILNQPAPTAADAQPVFPRAMERGPQPIHGESALGQILTETDNATLLRIARSRGISVTREAQLRPGVADNLLVKKIIDDFGTDELQEIAAKYQQATDFNHQFGNITPEAFHAMTLKFYFPDIRIPAAMAKRAQSSISAGASDLTAILQKSLAAAKRK